jgi:hypothetical protein
LGFDVDVRGFGVDGFGTGFADGTWTTVTEVGDGVRAFDRTSLTPSPPGALLPRKVDGPAGADPPEASWPGPYIPATIAPPNTQTKIAAPTARIIHIDGFFVRRLRAAGCIPAAYDASAGPDWVCRRSDNFNDLPAYRLVDAGWRREGP